MNEVLKIFKETSEGVTGPEAQALWDSLMPVLNTILIPVSIIAGLFFGFRAFSAFSNMGSAKNAEDRKEARTKLFINLVLIIALAVIPTMIMIIGNFWLT